MAGFLPQVDKLQALLKDEMSFKDKLEMAKMGKSRQLAEMYLPALSNAKSVEEAAQIQQSLISEAARYGIEDILPKAKESFDTKKTQLDKRDKMRQGILSVQAVVDQYGDNTMYNPFKNSWTSVKEFANEWIANRGGIENVYDLSKEFSDIITSNMMEEEFQAGTAGGTQSPTIVLKSKKKTAKGNISSESIQTFYYDLKEGKLKADLNQDGKITAEENASADVYAIDEVEKAMTSLRGEREKEFDNRMQLDQSARGWAGIALGQSEDRRKEERHQAWKENVKNVYVPRAKDVDEGYTKAFTQTVALNKNEKLWTKLNEYYKNNPNALSVLKNLQSFGGMEGNIGSEQLKSLSSVAKFLFDGAIQNTDFFYGNLSATERDGLKQIYGAYTVADKIQQRHRLGQPLQQSDFQFTINKEGTYSPVIFKGYRDSYYTEKERELQIQQAQEDAIIVPENIAIGYGE